MTPRSTSTPNAQRSPLAGRSALCGFALAAVAPRRAARSGPDTCRRALHCWAWCLSIRPSNTSSTVCWAFKSGRDSALEMQPQIRRVSGRTCRRSARQSDWPNAAGHASARSGRMPCEGNQFNFRSRSVPLARCGQLLGNSHVLSVVRSVSA